MSSMSKYSKVLQEALNSEPLVETDNDILEKISSNLIVIPKIGFATVYDDGSIEPPNVVFDAAYDKENQYLITLSYSIEKPYDIHALISIIDSWVKVNGRQYPVRKGFTNKYSIAVTKEWLRSHNIEDLKIYM